MMDYLEACEQAAECQGLGPVMSVLRTSGIAFDLWNSGGWTMIVTVAGPERTEIWLTSNVAYDVGDDILVTWGHICSQGDAEYDSCPACYSDTYGDHNENLAIGEVPFRVRTLINERR